MRRAERCHDVLACDRVSLLALVPGRNEVLQARVQAAEALGPAWHRVAPAGVVGRRLMRSGYRAALRDEGYDERRSSDGPAS